VKFVLEQKQLWPKGAINFYPFGWLLAFAIEKLK
jgi:hypothetical protein